MADQENKVGDNDRVLQVSAPASSESPAGQAPEQTMDSAGRRRLFLVWITVLTGFWVVMNLPEHGDGIKHFFQWAGFPFRFAFWLGQRFAWFDGVAFLADLGVLAAFVGLAWLCACSRSWSAGLGRGRNPAT